MDENEKIKILKENKLFSTLNESETEHILSSSKVKFFSKKQIIYLKTEKAHTMDIVLKGEITVQNIDENGTTLSIISINKGDMLGGNLIFSNKNEYPMTIISNLETTILQLKKDDLLNLCKNNICFLESFLEIFSQKSLILTDKIQTLSKKTIREKLFEFFLIESKLHKSNIITLSISKKELAEKLGVERPSLQREFKKMKDQGLIDYNNRTIILNSLK